MDKILDRLRETKFPERTYVAKDTTVADVIQHIDKLEATQQWQSIETPPTHRNDVLIQSAYGNIGIGWFAQTDPPALTIEYISKSDPRSTLDEEVANKRITKWMEVPPPEDKT